MLPSDPLYQALGRAVRAAREDANLTQQELGQRVGLKRTSITNLEAGRQQIQVHTLYALAEALGIAVTALLPATNKPELDDLDEQFTADLPPGERDWVRRILAPAE